MLDPIAARQVFTSARRLSGIPIATVIEVGVLLFSFRFQGHELFREGSRFFAGLAVDEQTDRSQ
jgi:hypothetical protein